MALRAVEEGGGRQVFQGLDKGDPGHRGTSVCASMEKLEVIVAPFVCIREDVIVRSKKRIEVLEMKCLPSVTGMK